MPSERVKRQIDLLLDEAEAALRSSGWELVKARAEAVLRLDPGTRMPLPYLGAAVMLHSERTRSSKPRHTRSACSLSPVGAIRLPVELEPLLRFARGVPRRAPL